MTAISRPDFTALKACRPSHTGLVFLCLRCQSPVFVRYKIEAIGADEITLHPVPETRAKAEDKLNLNYLPDTVRKNFLDAHGCYQHGLYQAFALMCRQTAEAVINDLGEQGKLKVFDQVETLRDMVELDTRMFHTVSRAIFGDEGLGQPSNDMSRSEASVLLEVMKDILYQLYVREARLKRALKMRSFFASGGLTDMPDNGEHSGKADLPDNAETAINPKITRLRRPRS